MSSFIDNFKTKAAVVSSKTKDFVEVNRLNMAIVQKEGEIKKEYESIGMSYYKCYANKDSSTLEQLTAGPIGRIETLLDEINDFNVHIRVLKNEKDCPSCNNVVTYESKFCPKCGYQFEETTVSSNEKPVETIKCTNCNEEIQAGTQFCGNCGKPVA